MRNIITVSLILIALILHEKNYAQSIDFDDFYIESENELNTVRRSQIRDVLSEFKIALLEDLEDRGERIPNRTFYEGFVPAKLQGFDIKYNPEMDRFIFGKARYEKSYDQLIITTYVYDIVKEENKTRLAAITYDVNDGFLDVCTTRQSYTLLAAATNNKLFPHLIQRDIPKSFPETNNQPAETIIKPSSKSDTKPSPVIKEKKKPAASIKTCSKTPAAIVIGTGAIMGGAGIYLRARAMKIYDNDYRPIVGSTDSDTELTRARRPNQVAHMVGAAGILTAGVGVWLWAKCTKRNKRSRLSLLQDKPHLQNLQITPELQYNSLSNNNTFHTKLTYHF